MKILMLVASRIDACSFYRSGGVARDLRRQAGYDIVVTEWENMSLDWENIMGFDIVMIQRPATRAALDLCRYLKGMGIPVWVDYDDDLFNIPPENGAYLIYNNEKKEYIQEIIRLASFVTVSTPALKELYGEFNPETYVVPNAFNDGIFKRQEPKERVDIAVWRGSNSHVYDLMKYGPAMNKIAKEHPEWEFLFMGYYPWFLESLPNIFIRQDMDLILYNQTLAGMRPAAVHVPLVDSLFNRGKSNIAYIEATFAGAVCIAPEWWEFPGILSYKNLGEYYDLLDHVIKKEVDIHKLNTEAWEYISDELTLSQVNKQRIKLIASFY